MIIPARYGETITKEVYPPERQGNWLHLPFEGANGSTDIQSIGVAKLTNRDITAEISSDRAYSGSTCLKVTKGKEKCHATIPSPNKRFPNGYKMSILVEPANFGLYINDVLITNRGSNAWVDSAKEPDTTTIWVNGGAFVGAAETIYKDGFVIRGK